MNSGRDAEVASPGGWRTANASGGKAGRLGMLYEQHAPDAIRLAALLTGDRAVAEDIVQEAFARLVGRLQHIREPEAFRAYLRKAVVNLSRMHFRRRKVERASLARLGSRPSAVAGDPDVAVRQSMAEALLQLPERQSHSDRPPVLRRPVRTAGRRDPPVPAGHGGLAGVAWARRASTADARCLIWDAATID